MYSLRTIKGPDVGRRGLKNAVTTFCCTSISVHGISAGLTEVGHCLFVESMSVPQNCGRSPAVIVGSNPTGGMDVCCECCVLSGRGLCD